MAQSNGDEELRERVTKLLWGGRTDVDGVMQLFEAYRKQHELEARIDELYKMVLAKEYFSLESDKRFIELEAKHIDGRLGELKAERSKS